MTDTPTTDALIAELRALMAKADQEEDDVRYYGGPTGTYRPRRNALIVAAINALPTLLDLAERSAGASGEREAVTREVLLFLKGVGPLDGVYFGDPKPAGAKGDFWWRKYLPALARSEADEAPTTTTTNDKIKLY